MKLLLLTLHHQQVGWECRRNWEGTQLGLLTPTDQRDSPQHMLVCSAMKLGRVEVGRGGHCSRTGWAWGGWWQEAVFFCIICFFLGLFFPLCCGAFFRFPPFFNY